MPKELILSREEVISTLDGLLKLEKELGISVDVVEPIPRCIINNYE
ncbi:MAG: hypothetical protein QW273_03310 [Candidatus Pacearchaeota archaeon]